MKQDDLEREARRVLEPLRYCPVSVSSSKEVEAGRSATVPRLAALIEAVPARRRERYAAQRRWRLVRASAGSSLALAAGVALWFGASSDATAPQSVDPPQLVLVDGQLSQKGTPLSTGVKYAIGSLGRLSTPATSGAQFVTNEGVEIDFGHDSTADLSFLGETRRIALNQGIVRLAVPKLKPGLSLSVATPDAVVTVHGTRFSVEIVNNQSCVRVSEGVVSVARGNDLERLTAGDESGCDVAPVSEAKAMESTAARASTSEARRPRAKREVAGTLTQENLLFKSALAAEQAGKLEQAELLAKRLLQRYPASPMAPEARRILARLHEKQADSSIRQ